MYVYIYIFVNGVIFFSCYLRVYLGVEKSAIEKIVEKKKPREIVHSNTRFEAGSLSLLNKSQMSNPSAESFLAKQGKIGVDGKEILAGQSPSVGGYGFVATPSPVPGKCRTP